MSRRGTPVSPLPPCRTAHIPPALAPSFPPTMSPADNSTVPSFHEVEINTLALEIVKDSISSAGVTTVEVSLAAVSFGAY